MLPSQIWHWATWRGFIDPRQPSLVGTGKVDVIVTSPSETMGEYGLADDALVDFLESGYFKRSNEEEAREVVLRSPLPSSWIDRLQESRKWRKFYDDQRHGELETSPAAPQAAPISKAPPALLNLHEELKKHDVIILDSDDDEPGPKKPRPECLGAAAFLEALPGFAKPAPPTPMADIMAEMDADFHGIPTTLMSAVNKPGSPRKVYLAGGAVVRALRPKAQRWPAKQVDLDFFFVASGATLAARNKAVEDAVWTMVDAARKDYKGTRADFQCSGRAISMFLCSTTGRRRGAGMDDWEEVEVQLILRTYNSPEEILNGFDLEHCAVALSPDCSAVLTNARGLNAIRTGLACVLEEEQNKVRQEKYADRGLCFKNMFEPWCFGQSDALSKQIDELQYPAATPEVLKVDCRGNAPPAVNEPLPVSGGVPLTDFVSWTDFKQYKTSIARLIEFNSGLDFMGFRMVDHQQCLGYFDNRGLFMKARTALIGKLQQQGLLDGYDPEDFDGWEFVPEDDDDYVM